MKTSQILKCIGANIRKAREEAAMTQEGLAELVDIHWKTVGYIEGGKRDFGAATLARIALVLKMPFNRVLEGVELANDSHLKVIGKATARKRKRLPKTKS